MTHWQTPIGDSRLNRALRTADLNAQMAKQITELARETGEHLQRPVRGATAGGDERKLRGIPIYARGVGGAIAGTRPDRIAS